MFYHNVILQSEVNILKVLGIYFDHKLTWSYMIDQLATWSRQ